MSHDMKTQVITFGADGASRGEMFEPGCVRVATTVPITEGFDFQNVVGMATVDTDGTATLSLKDGTVFNGERIEWSIGYRVTKHRMEDQTRVIEEMDLITVGLLRGL